MMTLDSIFGLTACMAKAGLAEGTNAGTIKIVAPNGAGVDYAINGIAYHKADTDNLALASYDTTDDPVSTVPVSSTVLFLVLLDASGNVKIRQGTDVLTASLTAGEVSLDLPSVPDGYCAIGAIKVVTSASATFLAGTTDLGAAGITDTYYDLASPPASSLA
jgi:hypothetical protein